MSRQKTGPVAWAVHLCATLAFFSALAAQVSAGQSADATPAMPGEGLDAVLPGEKGSLLWNYLLLEAKAQWDARRVEAMASLREPEGAARRRKRLHADYRKILGVFPEKTPLGGTVVGAIQGDGYRIEKVVYESWPKHHVTASLYVPSGKGPWPGVLVVCGHAPLAKGDEKYQSVSILLAKNGFVVLLVDPISQGERWQILDSDGRPRVPYSSGEHSVLDVGGRLVGLGSPALEAWDNVRGVDYLLARDEVDKSRKIGCTGTSGGGTQTTFLMALDERIGPAAPSGYIHMQEAYVTRHNQIDDGCQYITNEGAAGIEVPDYMLMHAPEPTAILTSPHDNEFWGGVYEAFEEAKQGYKALAAADRIEIFDTPEQEHGFFKPHRQAVVRWMRRWLLADDSPVVEPSLTVQPPEALWITKTGQVGSHFAGESSAVDFCLDRARAWAGQRERFRKEKTRPQCLLEVRQLLGLRNHRDPPTVEQVGATRRSDCRIERLILRRGNEVPLPALLFVPNEAAERRPATLYVDGRGKHVDAAPGGPISRLVAQGRIVLAIDVRGFGETIDKQPDRGWYANQDEYRSAMLAMHIGRPLLGQRVEDLLSAMDALLARRDVDPLAVHIVGIGRAGPVVLHAAALDDRIQEVTLRQSLVSWIDLIAQPLAPNRITHVVPKALARYDLPDLVRAIVPRPVKIENPVDAFGSPKKSGGF